jgi:hypothetical protein
VTITVTGALTVTPAGTFVAGAEQTLDITNGGAHTVTWAAGVDWGSGGTPVLSTAGVDTIVLRSPDGSNVYGYVAGQGF